jgi:hypothetical protein
MTGRVQTGLFPMRVTGGGSRRRARYAVTVAGVTPATRHVADAEES